MKKTILAVFAVHLTLSQALTWSQGELSDGFTASGADVQDVDFCNPYLEGSLSPGCSTRITNPSTTHIAYYDNSTVFVDTSTSLPTVMAGESTAGGEFDTTADYPAIYEVGRTDTGTRVSSKDKKHVRFKFKLTHTKANVTSLQPVWTGCDTGSNTQTLYLWNHVASTWTRFGSQTSLCPTMGTIAPAAITPAANVAPYIDTTTGEVTVLVVDSFKNGGAKAFKSDYVKLIVTTNAAAPAAPTRLSQFKQDGVNSIVVLGQTTETGATFKGLVSSGGGTRYKLAIEIKPIGTAFTNTPTAVSALTNYGTTAEVTVPLWKTTHHWQAWGIDNNRVRQAVSFPTPAPNVENESDIEATYAGTIYYVSTAGNDTTGTPDDPTKPYRSPLGAGAGAYSDIPADITRGTSDHIIQFMDSSTYGQLNMTAKTTDATHRIILRAAAGTTPTMDADSTADGSPGDVTNNLTLRILADNVVVKGLRFTNTNLTYETSTGWQRQQMVRLMGSDSVVDGCFFDGNGRTPTIDDRWFEICGTATNNLISGNRFDYSGGKAQLYIGQTCIGLESPGAQTIRNNVFSRFGQVTATSVSAALNFGAGIGTLAGNGSIVENNTFWNNGGAAYGLLDTNGSKLTVRNNIFALITGKDIYAVGCNAATGSSSGMAYDSIMFGNTNNNESGCPGGGWTLSTYYTTDPFFVNTSATPPDLHVESTGGSRRNNSSTWTIDSRCSVAIDKAPAIDAYDLEPPPNGGRRNIGAYGNTPEASKSCDP